MLDLTSAFGNEHYEIVLLDGTHLNLKRPTQAIQQTLIDLLPRIKSESETVALPVLIDVFERILNRNEEGIEYKKEELAEEYDISIIAYVVSDYLNYWTEDVNSKVNFQ